jgi:hypothetical protein
MAYPHADRLSDALFTFPLLENGGNDGQSLLRRRVEV